MIRGSAAGALFSLLSVVANAAAPTHPPADTQDEVRQLLDHIGASGCAFELNKTWYDARAAQTHLQHKYRYLAARGMVHNDRGLHREGRDQEQYQPGGRTARSHRDS
jgi:hypothetical protein